MFGSTSCSRTSWIEIHCGRSLKKKQNRPSGLLNIGTPAPVHESLPRRKQQAIGHEPNDYNDNHDADHLLHCVELAAVVEEVSQSEAGENGDVDFRRHQ